MIVKQKIIIEELKYGPMIKLVVDVERRLMALGCELHIDCMDELLEDGSRPKDLWGANIYSADKKIDFVSLINIRPADNNRSMEIQNKEIKKEVEGIIKEFLF